LALAPTFALAENNLAWIYAEQRGDLEQALALAEKAREHLPHDAYILNTLGWIYYKKNKVQQAIPLLEASVQKNPKHPIFYYHLGMAYYQNGELEAARRTITRSLEINANHTYAQEARRVVDSLHKTESRR